MLEIIKRLFCRPDYEKKYIGMKPMTVSVMNVMQCACIDALSVVSELKWTVGIIHRSMWRKLLYENINKRSDV